LFSLSVPITSAQSQSPAAISEYAEIIADAPELQRLSMRREFLGFKPNISDTMLEVYWSVEQVESITDSISLRSRFVFLKIFQQGSQASSKIGESFLVNLVVSEATMATSSVIAVE
jgi:hypothetical protein